LKSIWLKAYPIVEHFSISNIEIEIKDFKADTSESLSTHLGTSPMTLYVIISTYHTLETKLKDLARDTLIEWRNILIF